MTFISIIVLLMTGLPLRYAGLPIAGTITQAVGGAYIASIIHRWAAVLLILAVTYHVIYLGLQVARGRRKSAMFPAIKDVKDAIQAVLYNLGLARERPKYDRYSFDEKVEYWSMVWGSAIMIVTGALLWNPVRTAQYLPVILLKLARVIHSYEALLAFLAIIIWHFYHAHWRPGVFPMSTVWLNGLISEEEMKEHHPLEYERIMSRQRGENDNPEEPD